MTVPSGWSEGCDRSASWTCGSNGSPSGATSSQALPLEQAAQRAVHERDALGDVLLVVHLEGVHRTLEVVEHGQQIADQPLARPLGQALLLARDALLVVVELGRHAAHAVEIAVAVGLRLGEPGRVRRSDDVDRLGRPGRRAGLGGRHVVGQGVVLASGVVLRHERVVVSESTISASSMTSSSGGAPPSAAPPVGPACWFAWVCW